MSRRVYSNILNVFLLVIILFYAASCATVPGTGRKRLNLTNEAEINALAAAEYNNLVLSSPKSTNKKDIAIINKVGKRLSQAAELFLKENNMASDIKNYNWEFTLINSPDANAFCMPGGKIVFYTGILPYCQNEEGVAVVMGHEIAHALAKHGSERMSQKMAVGIAGDILSIGLGQTTLGASQQGLVLNAFGIASEYGVVLPFSRLHESEADRIGLTLMAMAGYDPKEAIKFWGRMSEGKSSKIQFFSTHPSDKNRIKDLEKYLPEAEAHFIPYAGDKKSSSKKVNRKI